MKAIYILIAALMATAPLAASAAVVCSVNPDNSTEAPEEIEIAESTQEFTEVYQGRTAGIRVSASGNNIHAYFVDGEGRWKAAIDTNNEFRAYVTPNIYVDCRVKFLGLF